MSQLEYSYIIFTHDYMTKKELEFRLLHKCDLDSSLKFGV